MSDVAQLLLPALRWDTARGFEAARPEIDQALALGVGGFILFGGEESAVRALTKELRQRTKVPLFIAADLERGAGQQFLGATGLPPLAAIASLNDKEAVRKAGRLTAREARTMGVNWVYAPDCDLDVEHENPIVGTRSLGSNPKLVSDLAVAWIEACQSEGVLACAKHFPGHGRTRGDSHTELPTVNASRQELLDTDIAPFRAAIGAGVASIMTAHVAYPALDASGAPATTSREILRWLLREQMKYEGLVVTDAMIMEGLTAGARTESEAAVRALDAGCDVLLYPRDPVALVRDLEQALVEHRLDANRVAQSVRRRLKWAQWASPPNEWRRASGTDVMWGAQLCDRVLVKVRGSVTPARGAIEVLIVDDDVGGPYPPPSRDPLLAALARQGNDVRVLDAPRPGSTPVIALFGDIRGWKGRVGYSDAARAKVDAICAATPDALVLQFSHPRLAAEITSPKHMLSAWGGDRCMQEAAARAVLKGMA